MSKRMKNKRVKQMMYDVFNQCSYAKHASTNRQNNLSLSWRFNVCHIFWVDYDHNPVVISLTASELKGE